MNPSQPRSMEVWNATAQEIMDRCLRSPAGSRQTMQRPRFSPAAFRIEERGPAGMLGRQELLLLSPDLFVVINQLERRKRRVRIRDGDSLIELQFRLTGSVIRESGGKKLLVPEGTLLICRLPQGSRVQESATSAEREDSVCVFCSYSYLLRHFGELAQSLPPTIAAALSDPDRSLCLRIALYPRLSKLARQVLMPHFTTSKRLVYAEGHLLQICCEVLAVLENEQVDCLRFGRLSDQDFTKLHTAREILIARHTPPPGVAVIAREVGLGTTKLKEGFKSLFGKSIFAFGHELRMNLARDLLKQSDQSIQQVAALVGYTYQHSLTVAFRQHFGVLPKVYRKTPSTGPRSGKRADGASDSGAFGILAPRAAKRP